MTQVEELKILVRMLPLWATIVFFYALSAQVSSTFLEQGMAMDATVGTVHVPPASMSTFEVLTVIVLVPLYDWAFVPVARRLTGRGKGVSDLRRIGAGLTMLAMARACHGRGGDSRDGAPPRGSGEEDKRVVAGAAVRAGGCWRCAHHHRAVRFLLQPGAAGYEDRVHGAWIPCGSGWRLPELLHTYGRAVGDDYQRPARVDPRRSERGASRPIFLDDGRTRLPESDGVCELRC